LLFERKSSTGERRLKYIIDRSPESDEFIQVGFLHFIRPSNHMLHFLRPLLLRNSPTILLINKQKNRL
jgi:hypothetical protein